MEAEAEVAGELAATTSGSAPKSLEDRFKALEGDSRVDDELEALKRQLPTSPKEVVGELPASDQSNCTSDNALHDALDAEYEKLREKLGK